MGGCRVLIRSKVMVLSTIIVIVLLLMYVDLNKTYFTLDRLRTIYIIDSPKQTTHHDVPSVTKSDMRKRIDIKTKACRHLNNTRELQTIRYKKKSLQYKTQITYLTDYNISYCGVGKTGGTFIKQIFLTLTKGVELTNRLERKSRIRTHKALRDYYVTFSSQKWRHSQHLIVSRNPYTRLFSAYIDRVSIPSITKAVRSGSKCRFDVTFQEFLEIVVRNTESGIFDNHWSPIYYICRPCEVTSSFIINLETFTKDIKHTLNQLHISNKTKRSIEIKLGESHIRSTITGIVKATLVTGDKTFLHSGCVGWFGALKQLWNAFKVQGYIEESIDLPTMFYNNTGDLSNVDLFLKTVFSTIDSYPLSKEERTRQRQRALVNAYAEVDIRTIEYIKRVYRPDFEIFGYSKEPPL